MVKARTARTPFRNELLPPEILHKSHQPESPIIHSLKKTSGPLFFLGAFHSASASPHLVDEKRMVAYSRKIGSTTPVEAYHPGNVKKWIPIMRGLKRLFPVSKMAIWGIYVSKEVPFFQGKKSCGFSIQGIFLQDFEKQLKKSVTPRDLLPKYGQKNLQKMVHLPTDSDGFVRISPRYEAMIPFGGR